jgi:cytosine/adenosine deaminase-related metal-dependent hydrolase
VSREQMLGIALSNGRRAVLNTDGPVALEAGAPADILLLDWATLNEDDLREDIDPLDLLMARAKAGHIDELIVGGRTIVKNGAVGGFDLGAMHAEIMARMRTGIKQNAALAAALPVLDKAIGAHFHQGCECG